jgi:hypothetical protein
MGLCSMHNSNARH